MSHLGFMLDEGEDSEASQESTFEPPCNINPAIFEDESAVLKKSKSVSEVMSPPPLENSLQKAPECTDEGTGDGGPNPLNEPLILRQVFLNLSTLDLLNCSEVNKRWNREARCVLRDLRTCVATNKGDRPCVSLRDLDADLSRMAVVPFTGLRLRIPNHPRSLCTKTKTELNFLRKHFNLKILKIDWEWNNTTEVRCPAIKLFTSILRGKHGDTVEELIFEEMPSNTDSRFHGFSFPSNDCLPELRVVRFSFLGSRGARALLARLIETAPRLQTVDLEWNAQDLALVHPNKYGLIRNFQLYAYSLELAEIHHFARQEPKLERLTACPPADENVANASLVLESIRLILISSAESLKYLQMGLAQLPALTSTNILPLENLRHFALKMPNGGQIPGLQAFVDEIRRRLNFSRVFPKIDCITVYNDAPWQDPPAFLEYLGEEQESPGDSSRITMLELQGPRDSISITTLAKIFPHVTRLEASFETAGITFVGLWSSWMNLERADIKLKLNDPEFNVDADLCGIFPDELAFLQEQDDEFLKSYHLVPVMLCLYSMKRLKELVIIFALRSSDDEYLESTVLCNQNSFFLSRVTGHLVLSRMKHLTVSVYGSSASATGFIPSVFIRRLRSFVKSFTETETDEGSSMHTTDEDDDSDDSAV